MAVSGVWADQIKGKALVAMEMVFSCEKKINKRMGILSCAAMSWLVREIVLHGNDEKYVNNASSLRPAPF